MFQSFIAGRDEEDEHMPGKENEGYQAFWHRHVGNGFVSLYKDYPDFARIQMSLLKNWVESTCEFVLRLDHDLPDIETLFSRTASGQQSPGVLGPAVWIESDLSERAEGGRTVAALRFQSGLRLVYKPKTLAAEQALSGFLDWMNAASAPIDLRSLRVIDRGGYGWSEYVKPTGMTNPEQVERFQSTHGPFGCGSRCPMRDRLPSRQPDRRLRAPEADRPRNPLPTRSKNDRVRRCRAFIDPSATLRISSSYPHGTLSIFLGCGLRGDRGSECHWRDDRHDSAWSALCVAADQHRFNGACARYSRVPDSGERSRFERRTAAPLRLDRCNSWRLRRDTSLAHLRSGAAPRPGLVFLRPTRHSRPLPVTKGGDLPSSDGSRLNSLRTGVDRSIVLDVLARAFVVTPEKPDAWAIVHDEIDALERLEVPIYRVSLRSPALTVRATGEMISDYFEGPRVEHVKPRLEGLDEQELVLQPRILEAAFRRRCFGNRTRRPHRAKARMTPTRSSAGCVATEYDFRSCV